MRVNYPTWNIDNDYNQAYERNFIDYQKELGESRENCEYNHETMMRRKHGIETKINDIEYMIENLKDKNQIFEGIQFIPHKI